METAKSTGGISVLNVYSFIKNDPDDEALPSEFGLELQVIFPAGRCVPGSSILSPHRAGDTGLERGLHGNQVLSLLSPAAPYLEAQQG